MHRQADDIGRQALACGKAAVRDRKIPVGGLLVHRLRIIDRGRDALCFQRGGERIAISALRQTDRVLRPDRSIAAGEARNGDDIAEA
jgi:hypothetical protein